MANLPRGEIIEGYYGEYKLMADMFIGFGRFSTLRFSAARLGNESILHRCSHTI